MIDKFKNIFFKKDFLIFILIGVINTLNGILFSLLYTDVFKMQTNVAFVVGYISSLIISYILNSKLTFKDSLSFSKLIKFSISYIPNFIIQNICVYIIYNVLKFDKIIAFAVAAIIGIPITFVILKFFAFKNKKN